VCPGIENGDIRVGVIAISHTTNGANDVLETAELCSKSSDVDIYGSLVRDIEIIFTPEG
jgi:hypothetical protein